MGKSVTDREESGLRIGINGGKVSLIQEESGFRIGINGGITLPSVGQVAQSV
jgi:hypothetical protein